MLQLQEIPRSSKQVSPALQLLQTFKQQIKAFEARNNVRHTSSKLPFVRGPFPHKVQASMEAFCLQQQVTNHS